MKESASEDREDDPQAQQSKRIESKSERVRVREIDAGVTLLINGVYGVSCSLTAAACSRTRDRPGISEEVRDLLPHSRN